LTPVLNVLIAVAGSARRLPTGIFRDAKASEPVLHDWCDRDLSHYLQRRELQDLLLIPSLDQKQHKQVEMTGKSMSLAFPLKS
jgi:hypothetical protein